MALWVCEGEYAGEPCRTTYAVGLSRCPRCHSTDFHELGSKPEDEEHPMAKITRHGGPSDATAPAPEADEPAVEAEPVSAPEAPAADEPAADTPDDAPEDGSGPLSPPDGAIDRVLAWVHHGDDEDLSIEGEPLDGWPERARAALDAELAKEKPRSTLVAQLEDALTAPAGDG